MLKIVQKTSLPSQIYMCCWLFWPKILDGLASLLLNDRGWTFTTWAELHSVKKTDDGEHCKHFFHALSHVTFPS